MSNNTQGGLSNEHIAAMVVVCVGLGAAYANRGPLLVAARTWLRRHQVLTDRDVLVEIPYLGGLDLARIAVLVGAIVVAAVVAWVIVRRRADASVSPPSSPGR